MGHYNILHYHKLIHSIVYLSLHSQHLSINVHYVMSPIRTLILPLLDIKTIFMVPHQQLFFDTVGDITSRRC